MKNDMGFIPGSRIEELRFTSEVSQILCALKKSLNLCLQCSALDYAPFNPLILWDDELHCLI